MTTRTFLVTIFSRKTLFFGDEAHSRRHFWVKNSFVGRREPFSSPFSAEKPYFLATKPILVTIFSRKTLFFGDEAHSRHHFQPGNPIFWRRSPFSSPFSAGKPHFLTTRFILVAIFSRKTLFFGDEAHSRRHFQPENPIF
ncbi:hypothetical protein BT1A1_2958 [Caldibacillus thermoamylovorans]|uniref:Uncharacterized protein n=1 Tax=Caldibacillus thermoamylovorans TaxID=35841 RepID=A0A090IYE5_9BACI|nr:hypothetical protein [Caldibacillus thermoamylovorans]CEE02747.1 hypothetical protein BT1A1_2958 [Caldibacillus thermoamylovorans]